MILPHGVLFRGNAEVRIRENLIKQGYIKGIIGLPANLFYGTGIPASIIVIDKAKAKPIQFNEKDEVIDGQSIFMIDASKGFTSKTATRTAYGTKIFIKLLMYLPKN